MFTRSGSSWKQQGKKLTGGNSQTSATAWRCPSDGKTALIGGPADNSDNGAAWVFARGLLPRLSSLSRVTVPPLVSPPLSATKPSNTPATHDQRHGTGRQHAHREQRDLERLDTDQLHLPVAALQLARRRLRRHCRGDGADLRGDGP